MSASSWTLIVFAGFYSRTPPFQNNIPRLFASLGSDRFDVYNSCFNYNAFFWRYDPSLRREGEGAFLLEYMPRA